MKIVITATLLLLAFAAPAEDNGAALEPYILSYPAFYAIDNGEWRCGDYFKVSDDRLFYIEMVATADGLAQPHIRDVERNALAVRIDRSDREPRVETDESGKQTLFLSPADYKAAEGCLPAPEKD